MIFIHRTIEDATRALYLQRINDLGRCMILWASQYYAPGYPWNHTESVLSKAL